MCKQSMNLFDRAWDNTTLDIERTSKDDLSEILVFICLPYVPKRTVTQKHRDMLHNLYDEGTLYCCYGDIIKFENNEYIP